MKRPKLFPVFLYALCAVIWSFRAGFDIWELVHHTTTHSIIWAIGNAVCALIWIAAFLVQLKRSRLTRSDEEESIQ